MIELATRLKVRFEVPDAIQSFLVQWIGAQVQQSHDVPEVLPGLHPISLAVRAQSRLRLFVGEVVLFLAIVEMSFTVVRFACFLGRPLVRIIAPVCLAACNSARAFGFFAVFDNYPLHHTIAAAAIGRFPFIAWGVGGKTNPSVPFLI